MAILPEDVMATLTEDFLDTREAASLLGFSGPDSLRTALYRPGSGNKVRGVEPVRDPDSGRLLWPLTAIAKAASRGRVSTRRDWS
jgi:hypothetical protein